MEVSWNSIHLSDTGADGPHLQRHPEVGLSVPDPSHLNQPLGITTDSCSKLT